MGWVEKIATVVRLAPNHDLPWPISGNQPLIFVNPDLYCRGSQAPFPCSGKFPRPSLCHPASGHQTPMVAPKCNQRFSIIVKSSKEHSLDYSSQKHSKYFQIPKFRGFVDPSWLWVYESHQLVTIPSKKGSCPSCKCRKKSASQLKGHCPRSLGAQANVPSSPQWRFADLLG